MAKTVTIDGLSLTSLRVTPGTNGQYGVRAQYSLLSGTQVFATLNRDVTTTLDPATVAAIGAAFTTVQAAIAASQLTGP
jgi:hypothetical protein